MPLTEKLCRSVTYYVYNNEKGKTALPSPCFEAAFRMVILSQFVPLEALTTLQSAANLLFSQEREVHNHRVISLI